MIGESIGHYTVLRKIGMGGMGEVFLARDEKLDRKIALKVLPPRAAASFFMLRSLSDGRTAQTGFPSSSAIRVLSTRDGCSPKAAAACRPILAAFAS